MADWRNSLLQALGAPQSPANLTALGLWAQTEGVATSCNNPLGATDRLPGDRPYGTNPLVRCYPSVAAMVGLYERKLESDLYRAVGQALKADAGLQAIWRAVNQSPWCAGCQDGRYPNALYARAGVTVEEEHEGTLRSTERAQAFARALRWHAPQQLKRLRELGWRIRALQTWKPPKKRAG